MSTHSENGSELVRKSTRPKVLTQKAQENLVQEHVKYLANAINKQVSKNKRIETKLTSEPSFVDSHLLQEVKSSLTLVDEMYDELTANQHFKADVYADLRQTIDRLHADQNRLITQIEKQLYLVSHDDVLSVSNKSRVTHKSPSLMSSKTTTSSKRLREAAANADARRLELQAKLEAERIDEELEIQERELESKRRQASQRKIMLELEAERQKSQLLHDAADEQENGSSLFLTPPKQQTPLQRSLNFSETPIFHGTSFNGRPAGPPETVMRPSGQATAQPPRIKSASHLNTSAETTTSDTATLVDAITKSMNTTRMPTAEPKIFNGDPLKYNKWKRSFNALIARKALSDEERLSYLTKYISPEVEETISGFLEYDGDENYQEAMEMLDERYGNKFTLMKAFRNRLTSWPKIQPKDAVQTRKLADALKQCLGAMKTIPELQRMNDHTEIEQIVAKLPEKMIDKWTAKVVSSEEKEDRYPSFEEFATFVRSQAKFLYASPNSNANSAKPTEVTKTAPTPKTVRQTQSSTALPPATKPQCLHCKMPNHKAADCYSLAKKPYSEIESFIKNNRLCYSCLKPNHNSADCRNRATCQKCGSVHPSVMHSHKQRAQTSPPAAKTPTQNKASNAQEEKEATPKRENTDSVTVRSTQSSNSGLTSMMIPVWLSSNTDPEHEILVYALLDTMSDATFVAEQAVHQLEARGEPTTLTITTIATEGEEIAAVQYSHLCVRGYNSDERIKIKRAYSKSEIPLDTSQIPTQDMARGWPHLMPIASEIPPVQDCIVGLLLGFDTARALLPLQSIAGKHPDDPFAVQTPLGWSIVGQVTKNKHKQTTLQTGSNSKKELPPCAIIRALEQDFKDTENTSQSTLSQDDRQFLDIITTNIKQDQNGYYSMPLPFKRAPHLTKTRPMAEKRLDLLKSKFKKDPGYYKEYKDFMEDIIAKGHAEVAPDQPDDPSRVNYIPHFGVRHPKKQKLRVVFDCSAKSDGMSLNDYLLQGPDQMNQLAGVLLRLRQEKVALMCDIEQMFHSFRVNEADRNYLRFLWYADEALTTVKEYRMTVHLFGATSSPGCAAFGLRQAAMDHVDSTSQVSLRAAKFIQENFYVDDGILSVPTSEEAVAVIKEAQRICSKANIRLHKVVSNDKEVMKHIPQSELAKAAQNLDFTKEALPIERALGVEWCLENDCFQFHVTLPVKPATRRGILSTIASVFDPFGFLAPFVLIGKNILQEMCRDGAGWDDELKEELREQWSQWIVDLQSLAKLKVQRCVLPEDFGEVQEQSVHHFSDASTFGYGQCSYIRLKDSNGRVHCSFLLGKARVAPLKATTIPRMELQAAVTAASVAQYLTKELRLENMEQHFWTDSKIVLGYVRNETKRFHVYVANRVQKIRQTTDPEQWHYISTKENPADLASRGTSAAKLENSTWLKGPDFLWSDNLPDYSVCQSDFNLQEDDPEVKKVTTLQTQKKLPSIARLLEKVSTWDKAIRVTKAFITKLHKIQKKPTDNVAVQKQARTQIIKATQEDHFLEMAMLRDNKDIPVNNPLTKLNPFLDRDGVLRVGGRLKNSSFAYEERHPAILPKSSHITMLLIRDLHERSAHQGRGMTLAKIRSSGLWIVNAKSVVSSFIHQCVICRKMRAKPIIPQMKDLPESRVTPQPPFTSIGVDCFGPFTVKERRSELKRYGLMVTCLASRAIHIEVLDDLSTTAFINGLRNVIAIRGPVQEIYCDRGTNFIGAIDELTGDGGVKFSVNPPSASHMGGIWERMIRTARNVLQGLLKNHGGRLDTSGLRTLFYEVMAIMNSRPLAAVSEENMPLTPNMLLTMKSDVAIPPPGEYTETDVYAKKRWRAIQHLANTFWDRWKNEYLSQLQARQKWVKVQPDIQVGSIVVAKDQDLVRNKWLTGKVVETKTSSDGAVRSVKILAANEKGHTKSDRYLERPVSKVIVLLENEQATN